MIDPRASLPNTDDPGSRRSDGELVSIVHAEPGSAAAQNAASELLERYRKAVYVWCRRYVNDHERAIELAQDVLLSAWQGLDRLDDGQAFGGWLMRITRNRCLSEVRRPRIFSEDELDYESIRSATPSPEEELDRSTNLERLRAILLEHLDPLERQALWLRSVDGLGVDSISEMLAIPEKSGARAVLQRARRKLERARAEGRLEENL